VGSQSERVSHELRLECAVHWDEAEDREIASRSLSVLVGVRDVKGVDGMATTVIGFFLGVGF
jgi:hypothetical protein